MAGVDDGPLFRPVDRHGRNDAVRLSGDAVPVMVKHRVAAAGVTPEGYSGHSLRSGYATSAAQVGVSGYEIRAQTSHASDAMLRRYICEGYLFTCNAAGPLL